MSDTFVTMVNLLIWYASGDGHVRDLVIADPQDAYFDIENTSYLAFAKQRRIHVQTLEYVAREIPQWEDLDVFTVEDFDTWLTKQGDNI